jgi:hypothetical protein
MVVGSASAVALCNATLVQLAATVAPESLQTHSVSACPSKQLKAHPLPPPGTHFQTSNTSTDHMVSLSTALWLWNRCRLAKLLPYASTNT